MWGYVTQYIRSLFEGIRRFILFFIIIIIVIIILF